MSVGIMPSAAWITCTTSHSRPLAEWIVDSTSQSSSSSGGPARSPVRRRRVERELGEEAPPRLVAGGERGQLVEVAQPGGRGVVAPGEHRREERAQPFDLAGGGEHRLVGAPAQRGAQLLDALERRPGHVDRLVEEPRAVASRRRLVRTPIACISRRAVAGPMPSGSCSTRNHATSSWGFSSTRRIASVSFTWAASMNFRPPYFTNGMLRRVSSTSS